jgi:hypothetical protein
MSDNLSNLSSMLSPKSNAIILTENLTNNFFKNTQTPEHFFESAEEDNTDIGKIPVDILCQKEENNE